MAIEIPIKARLVLVTGQDGAESVGRDATPEDLQAADYYHKDRGRDAELLKALHERNECHIEAERLGKCLDDRTHERDAARAECERLKAELIDATPALADIAQTKAMLAEATTELEAMRSHLAACGAKACNEHASGRDTKPETVEPPAWIRWYENNTASGIAYAYHPRVDGYEPYYSAAHLTTARAEGAAEEREACARVADNCVPAAYSTTWHAAVKAVAESIRARGK